MSIEEKNILWLDLFDFLGYQEKVKILSIFGANTDIRKCFKNKQIIDIVTEAKYIKMCELLDDDFLNCEIAKYKKSNIIAITIADERYPAILKESYHPPLCLYCKGNIQLLSSYCIGVVGTRKPTDYGLVVTKQYVKEFVKHNITIVSGLALGIDTISHNVALNENGNTIAVLAGGLNNIYPATNHALANKIIQNNLLISEHRPDVSPMPYLFPMRNRVIAGLSHALLIPEAGLKSGSMHTKNFAVDNGREVFAIPGKINSPASEGTNSIIKECQTCMTTSPYDLLIALGFDIEEKTKKISHQLDIREQTVLNYIQTEKKTFQEIADYTGYTTSELNAMLITLEMYGLVSKLSNNSYIMT